MDEMSTYYNPPPSGPHNPSSYPYYPPPTPPPPPPPPHGAGAPPPPSLPQSHFPQAYHHQHPPFASYAQSPLPPQGSHDDVRTLFIAGLPEDVKSREIYNLFRELPGYQSSHLRSATQNSQAYGFAVFSDQQSAVAAMQALNGIMFDLEKQSTLYIDLAKSNSRSKRSRTDDGRSGYSDKKLRGSVAFSRGPPDTGVGSNIHLPGMGNSAYNMIGYPSTQSQGFDGVAANGAEANKMNSSEPYVPQNNTPCPTLFVANLGPTCTEQELNQVFSRCPGFLKFKMQNKNGAPVAFVDFQDVSCSTAALNNLQDTVLYSSSGEGMRLEYAKSRMGMRRRP